MWEITRPDVLTVVFLSYYWAGSEMVSFHKQSSPFFRPEYVHDSTWKKFMAGAAWPIVARINQQFAFMSIRFLSMIPVYGVGYLVFKGMFGSPFGAILALSALRIIPVCSTLLNLPQALIAGIIWKFIALPLGCREPYGLGR